MADVAVIDTHVLQWMLEGSSDLNEAAREFLEKPDARLIVPSLCLLEFYSMIDRNRTTIDRAQLHKALKDDRRVRVRSLTMRIVRIAARLDRVKSIHDRVIAATAVLTALSHPGTRLVTADININQSKVCDVL